MAGHLIVCLLFRTVGRFILLHKYRSRLRSFPIIRKLDRKSIESDSSDDGDDAPAAAAQSESFYTLNHSGRKVKSIANSRCSPTFCFCVATRAK